MGDIALKKSFLTITGQISSALFKRIKVSKTIGCATNPITISHVLWEGQEPIKKHVMRNQKNERF